MNLLLYEKLAIGDAFQADITDVTSNWQHTTKAVGGYWSASGSISGLGRTQLVNAFQTWIGRRIVEKSAGRTTWEGYIQRLDLVLEGINYRISLKDDWFHNKVKVGYRVPDAVDANQGTLSYTSDVDGSTFTDGAQDFSEWETTTGEAKYKIEVVNGDGSRSWAYLGATVSATEIYVYGDVGLSTHGWAKDSSGGSPASYDVVPCPQSGADSARQQTTAWNTEGKSIGQFGTKETLVSGGEMPEWKAEALRDLHLSEFAWPRSRMVGGLTLEHGRTEPGREAELTITALGYFHTLNWLHAGGDLTGAAAKLIEDVLSTSEFVGAGRIESNSQPNKFKASRIPQGYGDIVESIIEAGDMEGNHWQGGCYGEREFVFEPAPDSVEYYLRNRQLVRKGGTPVIAAQVEPGFLLRNPRAPLSYQPPGTTDVWDDPQVAYVDSVTYRAPNQLQLRLWGEEQSTTAMEQSIELQQKLARAREEWR